MSAQLVRGVSVASGLVRVTAPPAQPGRRGGRSVRFVASGRGSQPLTFPSSGLRHPRSRFDAPSPQVHHGRESPTCRGGTEREDGSPRLRVARGALSCRRHDFCLLALGCQIPRMTDLLARSSDPLTP